MSDLLYLQIRNDEGALERVLRTTRHRGFQLETFTVTTARDPQFFDVTLRVSSERPVDFLSRQFGKLLDVVAVSELRDASLARSA
ncbi:MAG: acetolactate synthase 2 small subunit [Gammaproteobacteria bacterium]|nr:acetolactate synthase 2 small subunit [Gammaproteobacteria bacterium]